MRNQRYAVPSTMSAGILLLLCACSESPAGIAGSIEEPQLAKGGAAQTYPVVAEFTDLAADAVTSDSTGPYDDAHFRENGSLFVDARGEDSDRTLCFRIFGGTEPPDGCHFGYLTTGGPTDTSNADIYRMPAGDSDSTGGQVYWQAAVQEGGKSIDYGWFLRFGDSCGEGDPSMRLWVTRDAAVWTLVGHDATLCRWPIKGRPVLQKVADVTAPFQLTLWLPQH